MWIWKVPLNTQYEMATTAQGQIKLLSLPNLKFIMVVHDQTEKIIKYLYFATKASLYNIIFINIVLSAKGPQESKAKKENSAPKHYDWIWEKKILTVRRLHLKF